MTRYILTYTQILKIILIYKCPVVMVFNTFLQNVLWEVFSIFFLLEWLLNYFVFALSVCSIAERRYDITGFTWVIYMNVILQLRIIRKLWKPFNIPDGFFNVSCLQFWMKPIAFWLLCLGLSTCSTAQGIHIISCCTAVIPYRLSSL